MTQKLKTTIIFVAVLLFATSCHDYFNDAYSEIDTEESKQNRKGKTEEVSLNNT